MRWLEVTHIRTAEHTHLMLIPESNIRCIADVADQNKMKGIHKVESVIFLQAGIELEVTDSLLSIHRQLNSKE